MKTDPRAARLLVGLLVGWFSQAAWAGMELNGVVGTENYLGTHQGEFFDFRNANWFQLKIKADPHEQVAVHANLELRNTNFTQVQTIDELWDRGTLEPVSWRINEAYMDVFGFLLDTDWAVLDLRAGKQVLGWGEADGFNPSDKFDPLNLENPLDFKEKLGNEVFIDMESSIYTQRTIDFYKRVKKEFDNVGICLQAYLLRTENDIEELISINPSIRMVKGAYKEPHSLVFKDKPMVDENFFVCTKKLLLEAYKQVKK